MSAFKLITSKYPALDKRLLDYKEANQPVILYGKDTCTSMRNIFIHNLCKNLLDDREYTSCWCETIVHGSTSFSSLQDLYKELIMLAGGDDCERIDEILGNHHIVYQRVDFKLNDARTVYEMFTEERSYSQECLKAYLEGLGSNWSSCFDLQEKGSLVNDCYNSTALLCRSGVVFADNLHCKANDASDIEYYSKLALYIEERITGELVGYAPWLVAYAYDLDTFPQYFLEQFEFVSLNRKVYKTTLQEGETTKEIEIDSVDKLLKYGGIEIKLEPIQMQLLVLLYENKDNLVTRNDILDHIWRGMHVYEQQITDHISKIRRSFSRLGFSKGIIRTVKKSRGSDGGYIFNSKIASLDFH